MLKCDTAKILSDVKYDIMHIKKGEIQCDRKHETVK